MEPPASLRVLIQAFFEALEQQRDLERCAALLGQVELLAVHDVGARCWASYFGGILANERDHNWAAAERLFRAVIDASCEAALELRALYALGRTYDFQGRWDDAIAIFRRHLALATQHGVPIEQAKAWKHLAISYQRGFARGVYHPDDLAAAIDDCRHAQAALAQVTPASPHVRWLVGSVWNTEGALHMSLGALDQAAACFAEDLAICRQLGNPFDIAQSLHNLGEVACQRGPAHWPQAQSYYREALALLRALPQPEPYEEADILANLGYLAQLSGDATTALAWYREAIELIERLRARASSEDARAGFFATTVDTYALAVLLCVETGDLAQAFEYAERARARAFLDMLAGAQADLALGTGVEPATLASIQAALPADALLLACFTTGQVESRAGLHQARFRFPPERTLVFAVTAGHATVYDAGLSPNDLRPARVGQVDASPFLDDGIARLLYQALVAPAGDLLAGCRRLYLVPHGPLHYLPFAALVAPSGEHLLAADGPELIVAPSASFLVHPSAPCPAQRGTCLAVGYNGDEGNRLQFAEEEARSIAARTGGEALVGDQPRLPELYARAAEYRWLHFSCHGLFDPDSPLRSALFIGPGEQLTVLDVLAGLRLHADLVVLSACESGLNEIRRGDELIGLVRAFVRAGTRALVVTLWRVDEFATRLLMEHLYAALVAGLAPALALRRAQLALRTMTRAEVHAMLAHIATDDLLHRHRATRAPGAAPAAPSPEGECPFADPRYWAPFVLIDRLSVEP